MNMDTSMNKSTGCNICYKIKETDKMLLTSCNHIFCSECFFKWLKEKPNCPMCRTQFTKPVSVELEEELDELNREIEEYTNYREILRQGILIEEDRLKNIYNRENNKMNALLSEKRKLYRDIEALKKQVHDAVQIYNDAKNEYVNQQQNKKNLMGRLLFNTR